VNVLSQTLQVIVWIFTFAQLLPEKIISCLLGICDLLFLSVLCCNGLKMLSVLLSQVSNGFGFISLLFCSLLNLTVLLKPRGEVLNWISWLLSAGLRQSLGQDEADILPLVICNVWVFF
jgi:hypothetical protein